MVTAGSRLGTHEVRARLGAGGMGEVWRARDTRLGRDVALKLLPDDLAHDPERRRRFEREARLLAALNHPGIASLYGLEESEGVLFLVMELVEGRTLAERLLPGPLPIAGAIGYARQIAEALEAAHERGILHRDLKPQNVNVTPEGRVKLLDFGLAKVLEAQDSEVPASQMQTAATDSTDAGGVVGTAPYMSPEQTRGEPLDRRTDVWAFGCVLYEMLSGRRAFPGPTRSEAIAAVLEREPDWSLLPTDTPASMRTLLSRCLQKDKNERLHDIADARIELKDAASSSGAVASGAGLPSAGTSAPPWRRRSLAWGALALGAGLVGVVAIARLQTGPVARLPRLTFGAPRAAALPTQYNAQQHLSLAPDGRRIAFMAGGKLFEREVTAIESTMLVERGHSPFFSPDGRWVGFQQGLDLLKVPVEGGAPVLICTLPAGSNLRGASWGPDDQIVLTPTASAGLWHVPASSGPLEKLTEPAEGETSHRWPQVLPGGQAVLFTLQRGTYGADARLEALLLGTGERRVLVEGTGFGRYSPTGHLIYARSGTLFAVPFDAASLRITGQATPVVDDVHMNVDGHFYADFDIAPSGDLVYVPGFPKAVPRTLLWVDRNGQATPANEEKRDYSRPRLSPDGRQLAVNAATEPEVVAVWRLDLERDTWVRVTNDGKEGAPEWSADGRWLAYSRWSGTSRQLMVVASDSSRPPEPRGRPQPALQENLSGWSPDGRFVTFGQLNPGTSWDIGIQPVDGGDPEWLLATPFGEVLPAVSPDGRWMAYVSNEAGGINVFVTSFPKPGEKHRVSPSRGTHPRWSRDGLELFYRSLGERRKLMAVAVDTKGGRLQLGPPRALFDDTFLLGNDSTHVDYDVSPDGRFIFVEDPPEAPAPHQIVLIPGWSNELREKLRTASR